MEQRLKVIQLLEKKRKSKIIAYITSDRPGLLNAQMSGDVIPWFYRQLKEIGFSKRIDLFIYSSGGDIIVPWRLTNLIREFCDEFGVIIPYKSHSAATLLAMGADEILMGPLGELSPIDPMITTPFNPAPADNPKQKIQINVEDVIGYLNLAKDKKRVGLTNQTNLLKVFEKLSDAVHPLVLGATYRSHTLIRLLATKTLKQHRKNKYNETEIEQIVDKLAEKLYYHNYFISRMEAKELGLKVTVPDNKTENLIWSLYLEYETLIGLTKQFNPLEYFTNEPQINIDKEFTIGIIESEQMTIEGKHKLKLIKITPPPPVSVPQIQVQSLGFKWEMTRPKEESNVSLNS